MLSTWFCGESGANAVVWDAVMEYLAGGSCLDLVCRPCRLIMSINSLKSSLFYPNGSSNQVHSPKLK